MSERQAWHCLYDKDRRARIGIIKVRETVSPREQAEVAKRDRLMKKRFKEGADLKTLAEEFNLTVQHVKYKTRYWSDE